MMATISRHYELFRGELVRILDKVDGIAVTTDQWSSSRSSAYSTYTGHYIDNSWTLRSVVLETPAFPERHTTENIVHQTKTVPQRFGIERKITGIVGDQAANMEAACRDLCAAMTGLFSVTCACHRLQTAIRHALEIPAVSRLLAQCRRLVGHFKYLNLASHALSEESKNRRVL